MKKLIKIDFDNTTRERKTEDSYSELYSYDKNNGSFEFEILNDTLTTEQVTALFKFTESNKIWKTTGTVEGNKVKVMFDTSLLTQNETVICYLYFDEEQRTSDTFRFKFKVKVSEIDKMSRYEVKERFINNTVIVDRLDVVTKTELQEALKNVGGIATEGLLTEVKAEELYAKKSEAVDNTNFELVKNRVLALELKTDKDTIYNDSELRNRVEVLENKPPVDLSNYATKEELKNVSGSQLLADNLVTKEELEAKHYISDVSDLATKEELQEVRNSQPTVDTSNLVTRDELTAKNFLTEHQSLDNLVTKQELEEKHYLTTHQDLSEYAKKSELYNDTPLKERVTALESKALEGGAYDDKPIRDRLDVLEAKHDNDTIYDDTEVKRRLTEIESKPAIDTSVFVTEEKLNEKGYLTQHQSLENVVTKEELESKGYLTTHQDISNLATKQELANVVTKDELEAKHYVTEEQLNNKAYLTSHQDLSNYALKSEIPQPYNDGPLNERVTALESRPTTGGSVDTSNLVTKEELKEKEDAIYEEISKNPLYNTYTEGTLTEHLNSQEFYSIGNIDTRGGTIYSNMLYTKPYIFKGDIAKEKFVDFQTAMFTVANSIPDNYSVINLGKPGGEDEKVTFLSNKNFSEVVPKEELKVIIKEFGGSTGSNIDTSNLATKEELSKVVTKEELEAKNYVTTDELNNKGYLTTHQPLDNLVTKEELNSKGYVTDEVLNSKGYITEEVLNGKNYLTEDVLNTKNYLTQHQDLSSLVTKQELENKHYLTEHQPLTHLATTSDLEALRNIAVSKSELNNKLDTTEFNSFKDSVVTKTELSEKGYISDLSNYVTKEELPTPYNDSALVSRVSALESKPTTNQYEIHGTGIPNGVVAAEIGTTYVDKNKTNGALKWIKTTDGGNTGWEVLIGDTGWRTLNSISRAGNSFIKIRRVNNLVTYQFGGLQWGWFGVGKRNGPGFLRHNSSGDKGAKVVAPNGIPEGFRSENSLVGPTYDDKGRPYGIWYLGGKSDLNFIQFTFNDPIPTDRDIGDIRVSAISYLTEEPWPVQLP